MRFTGGCTETFARDGRLLPMSTYNGHRGVLYVEPQPRRGLLRDVRATLLSYIKTDGLSCEAVMWPKPGAWGEVPVGHASVTIRNVYAFVPLDSVFGA